MGEKSPKGFPVKLKTFRLTSNDRKVLDAAAALYGGKVGAWTDAPDEGMWQLTTEASELDILVPRSLRSVSQAWELWQGGTCERRCDGVVEELSGRRASAGPSAARTDEFCDIVTRLSVILPRLPGLGVWRLDTGGWNAASTIPSTLDLLLALDPGRWCRRSCGPSRRRARPATRRRARSRRTASSARSSTHPGSRSVSSSAPARPSPSRSSTRRAPGPRQPRSAWPRVARRSRPQKATTTDPDPDVVEGEAIEIVDQPAAPRRDDDRGVPRVPRGGADRPGVRDRGREGPVPRRQEARRRAARARGRPLDEED
jgi:hypothetical protein